MGAVVGLKQVFYRLDKQAEYLAVCNEQAILRMCLGEPN